MNSLGQLLLGKRKAHCWIHC